MAFFRKWKRNNLVWQFRHPESSSLDNIDIFDVAVIYTENDFLLAKILLSEIKNQSYIPVVLILNHEYMSEMINLPSDVIVLSDANEEELAYRILRQVNIKNLNPRQAPISGDFSDGANNSTGDNGPIANGVSNGGSIHSDGQTTLQTARGESKIDNRDDGPFDAAEDMVISHDKYSVKVKGEPIVLTFMEFRILYILAKDPSKIYSRNDIVMLVSNKNEQNINLRSIDVHVRRIRAKLGIKYGSYLKSMHGVGYYWNSEE